MSKAKDNQISDGRRLRSERSRDAILQAAEELMYEGNLIPTAQMIAERAGVGIRSFFRHFADMDTLFAVADERIREEYEALFIGGDRDGSLQERIQHAVERHADGFESVTNLALSTSSQLWRSEVLRKNYARNQRGLRKDLDDWIPELKKLDRADREAIDAMASFEMWHRLRYHQGLSKSTSIDIIVRLLSNLIDD